MFIVPVSRRGHELSRLFDETVDRFFQGASAPSPESAVPALDVFETPQGWSVQVDLPGVAKEDVKVSIEGRQVAIEAQARRESERGDKREGDRVLLRERQAARWARSLTLPAEVDQAASSARMDQGVLTLSLARRGATAASSLAIN